MRFCFSHAVCSWLLAVASSSRWVRPASNTVVAHAAVHHGAIVLRCTYCLQNFARGNSDLPQLCTECPQVLESSSCVQSAWTARTAFPVQCVEPEVGHTAGAGHTSFGTVQQYIHMARILHIAHPYTAC